MMMYKAMTIAGSDTSGGAGMEADLKTFQELGVYGMTALTCIVAQNPNADWAHEIYPIEESVIEKQLATILQGIGCDAIKTGMLGSAELVELVARTIDKYELKNVVIDPVMVCKGIDTIMVPEAAAATKELLVKRALVMTPNLLEAAYLADMPSITNVDDMKQAAAKIHDNGCNYVIIKAGDRLSGSDALEIVYDGKTFTEKKHTKIAGAYNHGAGCTFSAAVTAGLAKGMEVTGALEKAEAFIASALRKSFRLNQWSGALQHCAWRE
ncbi:MAG: bifunctional hydroxymethylpyrimidine kinase/phosphomethylpyrimidine kinase [Acidaminococcaceae bacterium]|nr:bifunctional hydroxymethylpyrimidine kinase/phosphomethylpyrimidine kinase [Acidaminococcaceae bacterium]